MATDEPVARPAGLEYDDFAETVCTTVEGNTTRDMPGELQGRLQHALYDLAGIATDEEMRSILNGVCDDLLNLKKEG